MNKYVSHDTPKNCKIVVYVLMVYVAVARTQLHIFHLGAINCTYIRIDHKKKSF